LLFGTSEFGMRNLPALANLIGVPTLYALGHRISGRRMGVLAALLWAVHPFEIWHAQDARGYALWAAASAVALWMALRALNRRRRIDWALYIIAAALAAYLYYLELFTLAALTLFVLIAYWGQWRLIRQWISAQVVIGLLLAPWFLQERLLVSSGYGGTTFSFDPPRLLTWFVPTLTFGSSLPDNIVALLWPLIVIAFVIGFIALWRLNRRAALLMGLLATIPLLLLAVVSLRLNVFTPRYVLAVVPAYILLFSALVMGTAALIKSAMLRRIITAVLLGGWLLVNFYSLYNYEFVIDAKAPDWRGLANYLHTHVSPDDLVIQAAADEAFTYYYRDFTPIERLPANPDQPSGEIISVLERSHDQYRSLWLVAQPPAWTNAAVPEEWLTGNMQSVRATAVLKLPVQQFMDWSVKSGEIESDMLAQFGDIVELVGARIFTPSEPTGEMVLWLYWRPIQPAEVELKIFVHLTGAINPATGTPLWAQDDQFPQEGRASTQDWSPSLVYRDVYVMPVASVPPGEYTLLVGLYDPITGQRVPLPNGTDTHTLDSITLP
jgi:hypothetical protein